MGSRGPAPKPTNVRLLHGDRKDRVNVDEPVPADVEIKPPAWLAAAARSVWRQYAPDLQRTGVLTGWDVEAFAILCDAVVRRRAAVKALRVEGEILRVPLLTKSGEYVRLPPSGDPDDELQNGFEGAIIWRRFRNPWLMVLSDADAQIMRWGGRFGMTPSDRAQLSIGKGGGRDPAEDLLS
ncbi:phage terminase small subunit P27 family [Acrocarpospora pleiomorpha]|uniref:phage terminase small subunit P27 family n=1 Tax=Acrocarpospora pleiomorpha TaxID=90975 RepID=UPI001478F6A2|nr:phage terminase small subunit P27 family [Acrocarpospora pleiomorpha]